MHDNIELTVAQSILMFSSYLMIVSQLNAIQI